MGKPAKGKSGGNGGRKRASGGNGNGARRREGVRGTKRPNILVLWGDDIGLWNISANNRGMMGYRTPNIDRLAHEGVSFTDYYGQQSCTAGRAAFITGQNPLRTGLTKVGFPGAKLGLSEKDPTIADMLRTLGYATGQFGKNHLGDRDEHLPTNRGFDEFFGNLYHLNAEEEPEHPDYPKDPKFRKRFGPRGVIHSLAGGDIRDTGPLTRKRMETIDEEIVEHVALRYHDWKLVFMEQRAKTLALWAEPFVPLRIPKIFNLRRDPFERADENSNTYWDWLIDHAFLLVPAQAYVAELMESLKKFPPRQKPASFNLDRVLEQLTAGGIGSH